MSTNEFRCFEIEIAIVLHDIQFVHGVNKIIDSAVIISLFLLFHRVLFLSLSLPPFHPFTFYWF